MLSRMHTAALSVLLSLSFGCLVGGPAKAAQSDNITIDPPANLSSNGQDFAFGLRAVQNNDMGGGDIWLGFRKGGWFEKGTNFSACSIHGDDAIADAGNAGSESGRGLSYECGRSYGMSVKIDKCQLTAQLHGYVHSDFPNPAALGPSTIDIKFEKKSPTSGQLKVSAMTLAGKIEFEGKTTGPISMPSCP
ncbi:MAG: hypothetical protein KGO53_00310 [Alphaproteobacteria bacterium]|nr:hypothetical protein [Alphaproteobacteria bacterium]